MHLWKIVNIFHKDHAEKPMVISASLDSASRMAKPTVKPFAKQKQGRLAKRITKRIK